MLEMADMDDIEDLAEEPSIKEKMLAGKKRKAPVQIELEQEFEVEPSKKEQVQAKVKASKKTGKGGHKRAK